MSNFWLFVKKISKVCPIRFYPTTTRTRSEKAKKLLIFRFSRLDSGCFTRSIKRKRHANIIIGDITRRRCTARNRVYFTEDDVHFRVLFINEIIKLIKHVWRSLRLPRIHYLLETARRISHRNIFIPETV